MKNRFWFGVIVAILIGGAAVYYLTVEAGRPPRPLRPYLEALPFYNIQAVKGPPPERFYRIEKYAYRGLFKTREALFLDFVDYVLDHADRYPPTVCWYSDRGGYGLYYSYEMLLRTPGEPGVMTEETITVCWIL